MGTFVPLGLPFRSRVTATGDPYDRFTSKPVKPDLNT
jgi:hypothetical protein